MSYDPNPNPTGPTSTMPMPENTPFGSPEPPKSNKKWWFLGCGGCLLFVVIVCGGGGAYFYFNMMKPAQDFFVESINLAIESSTVKEALGENVNVDEKNPSFEVKGDTTIMKYPIEGDDNSGTLFIGMKQSWNGTKMNLERTDFYIEVDGERINVSDDIQLDIDMGDGDTDLE